MSGLGGVKAGAAVTAPRTEQAAETAHPPTAGAATTADLERPATATPGDVYERGTAKSPLTPGTSSSGGAAEPAGDASLAGDVRNARVQQHAAGPSFRASRAVTPRVADGETAMSATGATGDVAAKQSAFVDEMRAGGVTASQPPTPDELRAYFGTFNSRSARPQALAAYERYADAYHVHPAGTDRPERDIRYSESERFAWNGRYHASMADLERATERTRSRGGDVDYTVVNPGTPDSWDEVTTARSSHEGRHINDCEGFTFMAQELLGAAGYRTRAVAVDGRGDTDHAMLVARDPARAGQVHVVSNQHVVSPADGRRREAQLLDEGYRVAGGEPPARYFQAATQDEAQTLMVMAQESGS